MQLQMLIRHFDIAQMTQEEINFLQLYFMEKMEPTQIAHLLDTELRQIEYLQQKFSIQNLPAVG